jgi:ankyrin repeat protein
LSYRLPLNNYDADGHTPLFYALRDGHLALATLLMDAGAALEISRQPGVSALHLACLHDWQELVERMLDCGASIEIKDGQNQTPLDCSLKQGLWDMALLLIRRGATTSHVDWVNIFCSYAARAQEPRTSFRHA